MKATKPISTKKTMNQTAQVSGVIKSVNKKKSWKNKTNKLTKTTKTNNTNHQPNIMTEDDIDRLFKKNSKDKDSNCMQTKVSTQMPDNWEIHDHKNFINSIKFLKVEQQWDDLLTGLPDISDEQKIDALFDSSEQIDLTYEFKKNYKVGKIIGEGAYASVRIAVYIPENLAVALKIYEKKKIKEFERKKSVRRQITILQLLNHPNIVKIYDVVETNNHLNIVMEHLDGISLGSYLQSHNGHRIPERQCKKIFKDLAKALRYMHSLNISHRDIKLENIILDSNLSPKFIDFGFSTCIESNKKFKIFCGTPSYMGPEVIKKQQYRGQTADIWALGVLLFVSLTGIFPFKGTTDEELYERINNRDYPKEQLILKKSASDLISKMLTINYEERITASEILKHQWFNCDNSNESKRKEHQIRKRIHTAQSNKDWANKTNKQLLVETCKNNLQLQIRKALKSPINTAYKEIQSYRKSNNSKQNTMKGLRSHKNTHRQVINPGVFLKDLKCHKKLKQKVQNIRPHSKIMNLLIGESKAKENQRPKSKTKSKYTKN